MGFPPYTRTGLESFSANGTDRSDDDVDLEMYFMLWDISTVDKSASLNGNAAWQNELEFAVNINKSTSGEEIDWAVWNKETTSGSWGEAGSGQHAGAAGVGAMSVNIAPYFGTGGYTSATINFEYVCWAVEKP